MNPVPPAPLLRRPAFRLLLGAQALGSAGTWMLRMATDWLVLELTGSPAAVGVLVALQFLPLLFLGPAGGLLADRHDKRRLVMGAQTATALLAAALAAVTLTGVVTVAHLYVAATLLGVVAAVEGPARQVLVGEVAGDASLRTAVSVTNALNQGGGLVGPALAGLLIAEVGDGWSFGLNALVCLAVVTLVAAMRPADLHRAAPVARAPGQLREGFAYVLTRPRLAAVVVLAGLMGAFGLNGPVVYSAFAEEVWDTGARGFGLYNSLAAAGALVGALLASRLPGLRVRTVVAGSAAFAVAETAAALVPGHAAFLAALTVVGATTQFFLTSAVSYVQLTAAAQVRGRVLAIYTPVLLVGHALGGLLQGRLAEELGVRAGLAVTGALALTATAAVAAVLWWRARTPDEVRHDRDQLRHTTGRRPDETTVPSGTTTREEPQT
ncbi:MFS transporter [Georgenia sp. M64]|uniref:MFS transporter n=1 Tax=Georgenia sp. M64 TaxID=3120520 RepID=UPI0030E01DEA